LLELLVSLAAAALILTAVLRVLTAVLTTREQVEQSFELAEQAECVLELLSEDLRRSVGGLPGSGPFAGGAAEATGNPDLLDFPACSGLAARTEVAGHTVLFDRVRYRVSFARDGRGLYLWRSVTEAEAPAEGPWVPFALRLQEVRVEFLGAEWAGRWSAPVPPKAVRLTLAPFAEGTPQGGLSASRVVFIPGGGR